ncbi:MAG: hypothetical protein PVH25_15010 [Burkholderiales bacterium]|jgi:hypothetical protein
MSNTRSFLQRFIQSFNEGFERSAQMRARNYLLGMSEEFLAELGISQALVVKGPEAWPWRLADQPRADLRVTAGTAETRPAAADSERTGHYDQRTEPKLAA